MRGWVGGVYLVWSHRDGVRRVAVRNRGVIGERGGGGGIEREPVGPRHVVPLLKRDVGVRAKAVDERVGREESIYSGCGERVRCVYVYVYAYTF